MEPGEYEGLVAKANKDKSFQAASDLLQFMRTHKVHQPELVLLHGGELLCNYQRRLGNEVWTVLEQVFVAACIAGHEEWRDYCIRKLKKQWPDSIRVRRLEGLQKESLKQWKEAKEIYNKIIEEKPEDTITRKRQIAVCKQETKGPSSEAIEKINEYLDVFCTDAEVWHELAELYIEAGSLSRAAYCFEELVLSNPRSMYHILTYAELLYSQGGSENLELSRKYFSLACYQDDKCLRALWGLMAVGMALAEKDKQNDKEKLVQLLTFCNKKLQKVYSEIPKAKQSGVAIAMLKDVAASAA